MKFVVFLAFVTIAAAAEEKLRFFEKDGYYEEKVKVDQKTVEYQVPKHAGVEQSEYLNDYDTNLIVMKIDRLKQCYAIDMPSSEYKPDQVTAGMRMFNKIPRRQIYGHQQKHLTPPLFERKQFDTTNTSFLWKLPCHQSCCF